MEKYNMSGVSGVNEYKNNDKQPDFTGKCTIEGKEYRMAGWRRQSNDSYFISWKFSEPKAPELQPQTVPSNAQDDLPF